MGYGPLAHFKGPSSFGLGLILILTGAWVNNLGEINMLICQIGMMKKERIIYILTN